MEVTALSLKTLRVAPGLRVREPAVTAEVAPVARAALKPALMVFWPLASVTLPTVSAEAVLALSFARKLKVPLLKVRVGLVAFVKRVVLNVVLSRVRAPP